MQAKEDLEKAYEELKQENIRLKKEIDSNKKISELQESITTLLNNIPALMFSKDVNTGIYMACNQYFAEYAHKATTDGVVGLTDFEIFDAKTAEHFVRDDKKALSMDKPYIFIEDVPDAEGNPRKFQTTKLKFIDNYGRNCLLGLCQDITDAMKIRLEYEKKLADAKIMANIDGLTGVKNKNAYNEEEKKINIMIDEGKILEFALTVFDVNGLKKINDTEGHQAGDEYIKDACRLICRTFKRSPVFRIGGDEFVVISQGEDYKNIEHLMAFMQEQNLNAGKVAGLVVACGMARFENDDCLASVFKRADKIMYENKKYYKTNSLE